MSDNYDADRAASERALMLRQAAAVQEMVVATARASEAFAQLGAALHTVVAATQQVVRVTTDG